ncbi:MAG: 5,6-dimethylbenzimidazole synthase [Arenicella sp.]|jgi:5,6-dimethylbenzimidazole synthase
MNKQFSTDEARLLEQIMTLRRDVRGNHFIDREISSSDIEKILHAGLLAPSVGFSQPWEFVVIRDQAIKKAIADDFERENNKAAKLFEDKQLDQYSRLKLEGILDTPVNIAVFYRPSQEPVLGQTSMLDMGEYSVVCAVQNMWLMARAMNIGIGWVSILDAQAVKKTLNAPQQNKLVAYLCVGHVDEFLDKPELERLDWKQRKATDSLVYQDSY